MATEKLMRVSDTPRTDAAIKAAGLCAGPTITLEREHIIQNLARQLERDLAQAQSLLHDIQKWDTDPMDYDASMLLFERLSKYVAGENAAPQDASLKRDQAVTSGGRSDAGTPAVAAPDFELKLRNECGHPWPGNYPTPASWYCKCGMKVYRSYEDYCDD